MASIQARMKLAHREFNSGKFKSIRTAAISYDLPKSTLTERVNGVLPKNEIVPHNRLLSITEETTLVEWILDKDTRGLPLTKAMVKEMAEILLAEHEISALNIPPYIGKNWVDKFIKRQPSLQLKYNRRYDYTRALCEDPIALSAWFRLVQNTIAKYGIMPEDIYNFDETGFQMGVISTAKVVTSAEKSRIRPLSIQPGNRQWVTAIETIGVSGRILPSFLIFKGKLRQHSWYTDIPKEWTIEVSDKGWTNDELGYIWLTTVFDRYTKSCKVGSYRLLILDGHGSHVTLQFDQYCKDNLIIVLCMPPHSSHLLQPLDVGCFAPLKKYYGQGVLNIIRTGINHIDKDDFLSIYQVARAQTFTVKNIKSAFTAAGIFPFDPQRVLDQLHVELRPITPPQIQPELAWTSETPRNIVQLYSQIELVDTLIRPRITGSTSPTLRAVSQLIKGCQLAMHSAVLLAAENSTLRLANEKVRKKRKQKRTYVPRGVNSTPAEVLQSVGAVAIEDLRGSGEIQPILTSGVQRAPRKCSICRSITHTARSCPARIVIQ
jgi:DDE superfamily endonuclease/Tc5 transposase-like DNA-binding protein